MTGLVMAEADAGARGPFANRITSAQVRQPSKEDLELAQQLVEHSEGRRDAGSGSCRSEHARIAVMGLQNTGTDEGRTAKNGMEPVPIRQPSPVEESQQDRQHTSQIPGPSTMGQVCRYVARLLDALLLLPLQLSHVGRLRLY